jgi:ATP dependent DNA ligase domain
MSFCPRALPAGFIAPCLPTTATHPPSGEPWLHEIKHDGFRLIARKNDKRVKLYSRPGNDLTKRFPLIVDALARLHGITVKKSLRAAERKRADVVRARRRWIREQRFAHM